MVLGDRPPGDQVLGEMVMRPLCLLNEPTYTLFFLFFLFTDDQQDAKIPPQATNVSEYVIQHP